MAEQRDPSSDPVLSRYIRVQRHGDDVIGGVAGGGQGAAPLACLVDGRHVAHPLENVLSLGRFQPHLTKVAMKREVRTESSTLFNSEN